MKNSLTKVPEITAAFWVTKVVTTAMGEATSDALTHDPRKAHPRHRRTRLSAQDQHRGVGIAGLGYPAAPPKSASQMAADRMPLPLEVTRVVQNCNCS
jgi:hypothetical protein